MSQAHHCWGMGIVLVLLGCFLLYAKSRHFPVFLTGIGEKAKKDPGRTRILAYTSFALAIVFLGHQYGFFTGFVIFLTTLMFGLCITVMFLPLHNKYAYILMGLCIIVILIENSL
ncbi:hypothetical protein V1387_14740 [Allomuricauda taeanensis]|uniref:hypothetical protein n=1 Tax=Flagellimonas taeanensis TaxID=1005926 RepID=UPI002E7C3D66|nr:hypothetical protein [Allomuricauda taeanensis]MEE1963948.1 hypothetical protein [Allomuricauda taeanensis]